jgi:hypothetical protein
MVKTARQTVTKDRGKSLARRTMSTGVCTAHRQESGPTRLGTKNSTTSRPNQFDLSITSALMGDTTGKLIDG